MRKIFISAGHTRKGTDSGAVGNGFKEGDLTAELRDLICHELLKNHGVNAIVDDDKNGLQQTINYFRALVNPKAILLDIHFNAATPQASGTECFIPNDFTQFERDLAKDLAEDCSEVLPTKLRTGGMRVPGVKLEKESARGSLGWMRLTGENVLLEVCFISNKEEMENYQNKKHSLAKVIAYTLFKHSMLP
jgi:N-acetylmuramoyl-L-alanine amidase